MLKQIDGEWVICEGFPYAGCTLEWMLAYRSYELHAKLCCMGGVTQDEIDIVDAALEERTRRMTQESIANRPPPRVSRREYDASIPLPGR